MAVRDVVQAAAGVGGDKLYVEDVFSTYLYTGNGTSQTINNGIDLAGEGGLVWTKRRDTTYHGNLIDTERGVYNYISSSTTNQEFPNTETITSFNSNGFSIGNLAANNASGATYASWTFRKAPKFFDVVTWTGDGVAGRTVAHNLGSVPGAVIIKRTDSTSNWTFWHRQLTTDNFLRLNLADAQVAGAFFEAVSGQGNVNPTDSVITLGNSSQVNASGGTYVAYLFAHNDAGGFGDDGLQNVISCGSYTGANVPQDINVGFEPQFLLIKNITKSTVTEVTNWVMVDVMRGMPVSGNTAWIRPNTSEAEINVVPIVGATATGFLLRNVGSAFINQEGSTYIYIAIRRPMKTPESGTEVFAPALAGSAGDGQQPWFRSGFPVDLGMYADRGGSSNNTRFNDRLRGAKELVSSSTIAEFAGPGGFDFMNGWYPASSNTPSFVSWMFRRAPGFMDVVAYTGDGVAGHVVNHNLGVAPEWIITKRRSSGGSFLGWYTVSSVYYDTIPYDRQSALNFNNGFTGGGYISEADSTSFTLKNTAVGNEAGASIIAYLFASVPNVSKVGTYTGTGSDVNVDCGFSSGARFVYVQRADATGTGKYIWDSARGIVSGNDPYLLINSTAAEVTNTDYIDPLASGFTVTSNASSTINISGAIYFFLAIA